MQICMGSVALLVRGKQKKCVHTINFPRVNFQNFCKKETEAHKYVVIPIKHFFYDTASY